MAAACRGTHPRAGVSAGTGARASGKWTGRHYATFRHLTTPHAEHPEPPRAARRRRICSFERHRHGRRPGYGRQVQQLEPCFLERAPTRVPTSTPCRVAEPPSERAAARASARGGRRRVAALYCRTRVTAPDALDSRGRPAGASGGATRAAARRRGPCWRLPRRAAH